MSLPSFYNRGKFTDAPKYVLDVRVMRGEDSSDFENQDMLFYKEVDSLNGLELDTNEWLNKCIITDEN
jgi:hypothetical protein